MAATNLNVHLSVNLHYSAASVVLACSCFAKCVRSKLCAKFLRTCPQVPDTIIQTPDSRINECVCVCDLLGQLRVAAQVSDLHPSVVFKCGQDTPRRRFFTNLPRFCSQPNLARNVQRTTSPFHHRPMQSLITHYKPAVITTTPQHHQIVCMRDFIHSQTTKASRRSACEPA